MRREHHDGKVQSVAQMQLAADTARELGLAVHLDGARMWNAAVALGVAPAALTAPFDSVSVCLSKGLGAPIGSVLVASSEFISEARRWRKMLGGGLRQVGLLAAAGRFALDHNVNRLADDHTNAERIAAGLAAINGVTVTGCHTNMVFVACSRRGKPVDDDAFTRAMHECGVIVRMSGGTTRIVTHLDVQSDDVDTVVRAVAHAMTA